MLATLTDTFSSSKSLIDDRNAAFGGANNATSKNGRINMEQGRGYDDPRFINEMFKLYDDKYGTNNFDAENKYHGNIGFLEFKNEASMNQMIDKAMSNVENNE